MDTQSDHAAHAEDPFSNVRYWWVNHKKTHRQELEGEFLWSAKKKRGSAAEGESSRNMTRIMPGDVVFAFSLAGCELRAVGIALGRARETPSPFQLDPTRKQADGSRGWRISVRFAELTCPWAPKAHAAELAGLLPQRHSPLRVSGDPNPGVYLASVPRKMAAAVRRLVGAEMNRLIEEITQRAGSQLLDDMAEEVLLERTDLSPGAKRDLLNARRGQGVFRANVERVEGACRLTGLLDRRHLRAVHIKPWRSSDDAEKLDGENGLLLSPHLEHLFSRGYVSFSDSGELLVSRNLNPAVLEKWGLRLPRNVAPFRPQQCRYLGCHRREVFERHVGGRRKLQDPAPVEDPVESEPGAPVTVYGED